jgi:hypothetical protein
MRTTLSPLRGLVPFPLPTHGLRPFGKLRAGCGLHSIAASRLKPPMWELYAALKRRSCTVVHISYFARSLLQR